MLSKANIKLVVREGDVKDEKATVFIRGGFLTELKAMIDGGYQITTESFRTAAKYGRLNVLQFLHGMTTHLKLMDESVCEVAAKKGHLEMLQWLKSVGAPWDIYTAFRAAEYGQLETLKWILQAEPTWKDSRIARRAHRYGHVEVLQWVLRNACAEDDARILRLYHTMIADRLGDDSSSHTTGGPPAGRQHDIDIGVTCYETFPCQHMVSVDGQSPRRMTGPEIAKLYIERYGRIIDPHFMDYAPPSHDETAKRHKSSEQ